MRNTRLVPSTPGTIEHDDEREFTNYLRPEYGVKATYIVTTALPVDPPAKISALSKITNRKMPQTYQQDIEVDASNIMNDDDHKMWLSSKRNSKFPQTLIIDLKNAAFKSKPQFQTLFFKSIGFRCWHAYTTNPSKIRILISSSDKMNFIAWQTFSMDLRAGT